MTDVAIADEPEQPEFEEDLPDLGAAGDPLIVDVDGFEGPMDLLLTLARTQKVDLKKISILALADQYLTFIATAKRMKLEVAADYLVMASWLAYLKSRLLLPPPHEDDEPTGEELAARLAFQLQRLEAMRNVAARLMARNRLGRDVFARGMPEGIRVVRTPHYADTLYDLLKAYTRQRAKESVQEIEIVRAPVFAIDEARTRLERMLGKIPDWARLDSLLPPDLMQSGFRRSALASSFTAGLAMVRDGLLEIRQLAHFGPIYVKSRPKEEAEDSVELVSPVQTSPAQSAEMKVEMETQQQTAVYEDLADQEETTESEGAEEPEQISETFETPAPGVAEVDLSVQGADAFGEAEEVEVSDVAINPAEPVLPSSEVVESDFSTTEIAEETNEEPDSEEATVGHWSAITPDRDSEELDERTFPEGSDEPDGSKGNES